MFSFDTSIKVKLVPGHYKLKVQPEDESGGGHFQNAGYRQKELKIEIHAGETLERTVAFTHQQKGTLKLSVLVNGSRSKAEISLRKAGSHAKFPHSSNVRALLYNMLSNRVEVLPGRYDVSVQPLESCFSPGGVDVFHGGVAGPNIRFRRIKGVEPFILHGITVKSGETLKKTVKFKNDSHYAKVCP